MSILLRIRHRQEAERQAKIMAEVSRETEGPMRISSPRPAGDERTLRGIPAIGRNVAGAVPGTTPHALH